MQIQEYQVKDIIRIVGVERPTTQYWLRERVVHPDYSGDTTRGVARRFSFANLVEFAIAKALTQRGIEAKHLGFVLRACRNTFSDYFTKLEPTVDREEYPLIILISDEKHQGFAFRTVSMLRKSGIGPIHFLGKPGLHDYFKVELERGVRDVTLSLVHDFAAVTYISLERIKRQLMIKV